MDILSKARQFHSLGRFWDILKILTKYGFADLFRVLPIVDWSKVAPHSNGISLASYSQNERIRLALTDLGTTFIKLGQFLSTREDLIGADLAHELQKLQAGTPPDSPETVRTSLEKELRQPIGSIFDDFQFEALASASIGQVHPARLKNGQEVLLKIQHEGIEAIIRQDLELIAFFAEILELHFSSFKPYQPQETAKQFQRTLLNELDFSREKRNIEEFTRNFSNDKTVHFPMVYPEYCRPRLLIMEKLNGIPGTNPEELRSAGVDMVQFVDSATTIFFKMIFRDGFYHADPHPGNYMLLQGGVVGLIDFGMVGRIDNELREELEEFVMGCVNQDSLTLADLILRIGHSPTDVDRNNFQSEVADLLSDYWGISLKEFNLGDAFGRLNGLMWKFKVFLPPPVSLLIKTLVMLEGSAKRLDPDFGLGAKLMAFKPQILKSRLSPKRWWQKIRRNLQDWDRFLSGLPRNLAAILEVVRSGHLNVRHEHGGLENAIDRGVQGILAAALFLGSTQLVAQKIPPTVWDISLPGLTGSALAFYLGFHVLKNMKNKK